MFNKFFASGLVFISLCCDTALASDLPTAPVRAPVMYQNATPLWSGVYVGAHWGVGKGETHWSDPQGIVSTPTYGAQFPSTGVDSGTFVGGTFGLNEQYGAWVFGLEGDVSSASIAGNSVCTVKSSNSVNFKCLEAMNWLGSLSGRLGYAFGSSMIFAKLGASYSYGPHSVGFRKRYDIGTIVISGTNQTVYLNEDVTVQKSDSLYGAVLGIGVEHKLTEQWSVKAEYDYNHFMKSAFRDFASGYDMGASTQSDIHTFKFGLNYSFGDYGHVDQAQSLPVLANDVSVEVGARTGWSNGFFKKNLHETSDTSPLLSWLTWSGQAGAMAETFVRLDHRSGLFAKGFIGGVNIAQSTMHDEDAYFAYGNNPNANGYSNTVSSTKNGHDIYGTLDLGYDFVKLGRVSLGSFIGYNHYEQNVSAYGCQQIAANALCNSNYGNNYNNDLLLLSQRESWDSARLGLIVSAKLTDRLKLTGEAAWLPYSYSSGVDNHWLRSDINPANEKGVGHKGYQLESALSYALNEKVSLGVGARYWSFDSKGTMNFGAKYYKQALDYNSNRLTLYTQLSYKLGTAQ
jgi:opacity protein-like surface antigen